ncbi:conserved hypothetical protein [Azospirillaceae bacterium]
MSDWEKYKVGKPSTRVGWEERDCWQFNKVGHTTHVDPAIEIIRGKKIRAGLVFDKSRLNKHRIQVVWLSPNDWEKGYRYGGVKFEYSFRDLVDGMNYYWVEVITSYSPCACRILITDQDRSEILPVYDPTVGDGPWWFNTKSGKDYFNNYYCVEFMVERDFDIDDLCGVEFVKHHDDYCALNRRNPKACKERGLLHGQSGAAFLTKVGAMGLDLNCISDCVIDSEGEFSSAFWSALSYFLRKYDQIWSYDGTITETDPLAIPVSRGIMNAVVVGREEEAVKLARLFLSQEALWKTAAMILDECLATGDWGNIYKKIK